MRTFVAIFPPPEVRKKALNCAKHLPLGERVRWTKLENVHLTLKFLGDVREEVLDDLCAALEETCAKHTPFDVGLTGLEAFPSARRARILWAGVGAGSEPLRSLTADLDTALAALGFEREERPYTPHLTLGRVRGRPASFDLPQDMGDLQGFRVRQIELMKSTLTAAGPIYRTVRAFDLKKRKELDAL